MCGLYMDMDPNKLRTNNPDIFLRQLNEVNLWTSYYRILRNFVILSM